MKGNLDGIQTCPFINTKTTVLLWGASLVQVAMMELTQIIVYVYIQYVILNHVIMCNRRLKLILYRAFACSHYQSTSGHFHGNELMNPPLSGGVEWNPVT